MRYTQPNVLSTLDANLAIQSVSGPQDKATPVTNDSQMILSTTAAYEADE